MNKKIFIFFVSLFFINPGFSGNCDLYKKQPKINMERVDWDVKISASDGDIWPRAGYVKVMPFSNYKSNIAYVYNGKYYCVFLDSVDVKIGFKDFEIIIDKKYEKDSCEYNAVLEHENHHISDSEKAFEIAYKDLESAITDVANSIEPIYVQNADDVPQAFENLNNQMLNSKKLQDLVERFYQQTQHDAGMLDNHPDEKLMKCETDKIKAAFDKYFKEKGDKK